VQLPAGLARSAGILRAEGSIAEGPIADGFPDAPPPMGVTPVLSDARCYYHAGLGFEFPRMCGRTGEVPSCPAPSRT
jgi:hypothetical protein